MKTTSVGPFCSTEINYSRKVNMSIAQKLFEIPFQDIIPAHGRSFVPEWQKKDNMDKQVAKSMWHCR